MSILDSLPLVKSIKEDAEEALDDFSSGDYLGAVENAATAGGKAIFQGVSAPVTIPMQVGATSAGRAYGAYKNHEAIQKEKEKQSKETKDLADDFAAYDSQCILNENIRKFVTNSIDNNTYKHFGCVHGGADKIITKLSTLKNLEAFWDITTEELAHLVPYIKIYKTWPDNGDNPNSETSLEVPFETSLDKKSLSSMTKTSISRGSGVGLVSYDWALLGSNTATATNVIDVGLKFRLESLQDLITVRSTIDTNGNPKKFRFMDFFTPPKKNLEKNVYNPNYFKFKVVTGWSIPNGPNTSTKRWKAIKDVLYRERTVLSLAVTSHEFEITKEGVVYATIKAIGSVDAYSHMTEETDVFSTTNFADRSFVEEIDELNSELEKKEKENKEYEEETNTISESRELTEEEKNKLEKNKKDFKEYEKKIEKQKNQLKGRIYASILSQIMNNNGVWLAQAPSNEFKFGEQVESSSFDRAEFELKKFAAEAAGVFGSEATSLRKDLSDISRRASGTGSTRIVRKKNTENTKVDYKNIKILKFSDSNVRFRESLRGAELINHERDNLENLTKEVKSSLEAFAKGQFSKGPSGEVIINIPFIYFGDVLDVAYKAIYGKREQFHFTKKNKSLVGDIVVYDAQSKKRLSVNMADVPITLNLFQQWMTRNIYGEQRSKYPVNEFIKDAFKLLSEALNINNCNVVATQSTIKLAKASISGVESEYNKAIYAKNRNRFRLEDLHSLRDTPVTNPDKDMTFTLLYCANAVPLDLTSNPVEDIKQGIPWVYLGRDRGLVKDVKFTRQDIPYARESRIVKDGDSVYGRLREVYNAEITLYGNNICHPGQLIYINPSTIMLGNLENGNSIAAEIGFVGYYRVVKVNSFIQSGKYETKISAMWEQGGSGSNYGAASRDPKKTVAENNKNATFKSSDVRSSIGKDGSKWSIDIIADSSNGA